jgi:hypothetical protein
VKTTYDLFRNSVNNTSFTKTKKSTFGGRRDSSMNLVDKEADKKTRKYTQVQGKLEILKMANEEISKKKALL